MERGDSGYTEIVAGMPDQEVRLPRGPARRLDEAGRRALVERMRRQGWSYRRISKELNISYAQVSQWLDGPAALTPLEPLPARLGAPRGAGTAARPAATSSPSPDSAEIDPLIGQLISQNRDLLTRVEQLVAASSAQQQAIAGLEARLVANIEDQHKKLGERLVEAVKSLLAKFAGA